MHCKVIKLKIFYLLLLFLLCHKKGLSQGRADSIKVKNEALLSQLESLIKTNGSFREAVFVSEQGYQNKVSPHNYYCDFINSYTKLAKIHFATLKASTYKQPDSINYLLNLSLFDIFSKSIPIKSNTHSISTTPFFYNYDDPQGDEDFGSTFVTRLLATHYGNCRSLTYLYKILADETGAKCWLSLAPNHIYIRNYNKKTGWYNTELTSGTFPTDAWIAASGYVSADAIRSGVYMDTLSNQQAIGLCILDLVHGYIRQTNNYTDGFVLKSCNTVLQYHSVNPMALLLKAEALKRLWLEEKKNKSVLVPSTYTKMEEVYAQLLKLEYREMPYKVYQQWLKNTSQQKDKFGNLQPHNKINN